MSTVGKEEVRRVSFWHWSPRQRVVQFFSGIGGFFLERWIPIVIFIICLCAAAIYVSYQFPVKDDKHRTISNIQTFILALSVYASFLAGLIAFCGHLYRLARGGRQILWQPPHLFALYMGLTIFPGMIAVLYAEHLSFHVWTAACMNLTPAIRDTELTLELLAIAATSSYLLADLCGVEGAEENADHLILSRIDLTVLSIHLVMFGVANYGYQLPIIRDYYIHDDDGQAIRAFSAGAIGLMLVLQNVAFAFLTNVFEDSTSSGSAAATPE